MSSKFPGGVITKSPAATVGPGGDFNEGGSASGMWTLDQALALKSAGLWPAPSKEKYLWTWGKNDNGTLGDNTAVYRSSPIQVGALTTWSKITGGEAYSVAIKTDGTMWSWGDNTEGKLGDGTLTHRSSPVQVGTLSTWSKISGGIEIVLAIEAE